MAQMMHSDVSLGLWCVFFLNFSRISSSLIQAHHPQPHNSDPDLSLTSSMALGPGMFQLFFVFQGLFYQ